MVFRFIPPWVRNALVIVFGEFAGTFLYLFLAFVGAQAAIDTNNLDDLDAPLGPASLLYVASSFGSSLTINVWIFYRVTGGMFNPAVTLGLALVGAVKPFNVALIIPSQIIGAIAAAAAAQGMLPGTLGVANTLNNGTTTAQGLFIEMFLTAQLVLAVYFLAVEKHRATFLAPLGIGISAFIAHVAGTRYTGTSINPARSFGPAVIVGFTGYHWIFWLGPCLGAFLAFGIYRFLKWLEFPAANPGQDAEDEEKAAQATEQAEQAELQLEAGHSTRASADRPRSHGRV